MARRRIMESRNVSLPIDEIAALFNQLVANEQNKRSNEVEDENSAKMVIDTPEKKKSIDIVARVEKVGDNYRIIQAVPSRKLSERAVTTSRAIDNASIVAGAISIVLLILEATSSKEDNESCKDEYAQWISIALNLATPLTALKNKILDYLKKPRVQEDDK